MNTRAPMAAAALLAAMVLSTAACGGSSKSDSQATASVAARTVSPAPSATPQRTASVSETLAVVTTTAVSTATAAPAATTSVATATTAAATATPAPPTATPVPPTPTAVPTSAYPMSATITALTTAFQWSPADVTIGAGGTVTWSWAGDTFHDLASSDGNFNPGFPEAPMKAWTGSVTFHTPGVYKYLCTVHTNSRTSMRGTITVK